MVAPAMVTHSLMVMLPPSKAGTNVATNAETPAVIALAIVGTLDSTDTLSPSSRVGQMRGVVKQRKMAAKFGQDWCDKGFHFTAIEEGQYVTWGGRFDEEPWPKPCRSCVAMYEEEGYPITITD